ncbi:MAG: hypothetical protein WDN04_08450 [Rhodospirillales bacterium]
MGYISDQIAEYMRAADAEDTAARRRSLEIMKTHPLTLPDWRAVKECLEKHELYGDLEEVTRSFIEAGGPATIEPYLTLASLRRSDQGYGIILKYLDEFGDLPANRPHVITSLYKMMQYGACLEFTVSALRSDPTNVIFRAFEARCLWRLGRRRYAHRKHMAIKKLLGRDAGKWIWFLTVAFEFGDARLVRKSAEELTLLLSDNRTTVPRNIITLFTDVGVPEFAQRLIRSARPEDYHDPSDLHSSSLTAHCASACTNVHFGSASGSSSSSLMKEFKPNFKKSLLSGIW